MKYHLSAHLFHDLLIKIGPRMAWNVGDISCRTYIEQWYAILVYHIHMMVSDWCLNDFFCVWRGENLYFPYEWILIITYNYDWLFVYWMLYRYNDSVWLIPNAFIFICIRNIFLIVILWYSVRICITSKLMEYHW